MNQSAEENALEVVVGHVHIRARLVCDVPHHHAGVILVPADHFVHHLRNAPRKGGESRLMDPGRTVAADTYLLVVRKGGRVEVLSFGKSDCGALINDDLQANWREKAHTLQRRGKGGVLYVQFRARRPCRRTGPRKGSGSYGRPRH